jgi:PAS domain S-box-containing protein
MIAEIPEIDTINNRRYQLLLDSDDCILIVGADRLIRFVNRAYISLWNNEELDFRNKDFTEGLSETKKRWYLKQMAGISAENPVVSFTLKSGREGAKVWMFWKVTGIFDNKGTLEEVLAVGKNIHDKVETQRENERILNTLTAFKKAIDSNIICSITDEKGIITYTNRNFCNISGYSQEEMLGRTHNIVNSGFHQPEFFANMWRTIKSGKMWTGEVKNKKKNGGYYWVNSVIIPIKDKKKRISGFLSLRIPIDKQKEMEEERKQYQKSLEEMLFIVSHEIRKPLTTCQGLLYIMRDEQPADTIEYDEMISYLISTADELNDYSYKLNEYLEKNIKRELPSPTHLASRL